MKFAWLHPNDNSVLSENYTIDHFRVDFNSVSIGSDWFNGHHNDELAQFNIYPIVDNPPNYDPNTQRLQRGGLTFDPETSTVTRNYTVVPYTPPSELTGGTRMPTSAELDADRTAAGLFYQYMIQSILDAEAGFYKFGRVVKDPRTGLRSFVPDIASAAKYTSVAGPFRANATKLMVWASDVWKEAERIDAQWKDGQFPAPTWDELRAMLLAAAPAPVRPT